MSQYLIAVALGPVQEFIAAGRKTRDLWFGSMLLGKMSREAAKELNRHVVKANGDVLIFPYIDDAPGPRGDESPVPNKLLAIVTTDAPDALAGCVRAAAQAVLDDATKGYLRQVHDRLGADAPVNWPLADTQIEDFLEFYAAWVLYQGEIKYRDQRREVERLLAGRKALRDFKAAPHQLATAKSSLDPSRETVFILPDGSPLRAGQSLSEKARSTLLVKGAEQLDGISLIKRHAEVNRFASVSRIAIDPLIRRLAADDAPASTDGADVLKSLNGIAEGLRKTRLVEKLPMKTDGRHRHHESNSPREVGALSQFDAFPYDCQLFYQEILAEENVAETQTKPKDEPLSEDERKKAREFNQIVRAACKLANIAEPPAYFAVLAADGDRMGKAIGELTTPDLHRAFSEALSKFADAVDRIVQEHNGAPIYSGGDDVLAFLPVDRAIACAEALKDEFLKVNAAPKSVDPAFPDLAVSLSVGVSIGQYHANLNDLLRWGREAEVFAKAPAPGGNRDALAVALHTASGGADATLVAHGWGAKLSPVERWTKWTTWHRLNEFPDGAAYELRDLARDLGHLALDAVEKRVFTVEETVDGVKTPVQRSFLELEMLRVLARKRPEHGSAKLNPAPIETLVLAVQDEKNSERSSVKKLGQLADELIIARRIAEITEIASPIAAKNDDKPKERADE